MTLNDDWLTQHGGTPAKVKRKRKSYAGLPNPLIALYGAGPELRQCKECKHFYRKEFASVYRKCDLRPDTNGPGTDHRATWPACGRFGEPNPVPTP